MLLDKKVQREPRSLEEYRARAEVLCRIHDAEVQRRKQALNDLSEEIRRPTRQSRKL